MPTLRHLTIDDFDKIILFWQEAGLRSVRLHGRDSRDAFAEQLANGQVVIGLEEADQLIGAVVITKDARKGWINRLAVHPNHRGKGYAAQLLAAAEEQLHAMGLHVFAGLIEADNIASLALFAKQGYRKHDVVYVTKRDSEDM
jgi:ribosomal protein S18 acetylase RimI-like enzyme